MRVLYCTDTYPPQVNGVSVVTALQRGGPRRGAAGTAPSSRRGIPAGADGRVARAIPAAGAPVTSLPSVAVPGLRRAPARDRGPANGAPVWSSSSSRISCTARPSSRSAAWGSRPRGAAGIPVVSSYHTDFGRYAAGLRHALAPPGRDRLSRGRFHRRSRRVYTPSAVAKADLLRPRRGPGRGLGPRRRHDGLPSASPQPGSCAQPSAWAAGSPSCTSGGSRRRSGWMSCWRPSGRRPTQRAPRRHPPRHRGDRAVRGGAPGRGAARRHLPGLSRSRGRRLPDLYANCDAFVFASVTETLGLVVLEAMASGLPVIAAPEGGVRDHLRDGVNGLTYAAGDAAAMARAMVLLVGRMGAHPAAVAPSARRTAEGLSWDRELDRLDASYREVCAGGAAGPSLGPIGKHAGDRRPAPPLALGVHPSAVRLDEMLHDGQA